jgi:hypothetical protein
MVVRSLSVGAAIGSRRRDALVAVGAAAGDGLRTDVALFEVRETLLIAF